MFIYLCIYICVHKHMYITAINKEAMNLNESKERHVGGLGRRKVKGMK